MQRNRVWTNKMGDNPSLKISRYYIIVFQWPITSSITIIYVIYLA
jgi:hypothetical protein